MHPLSVMLAITFAGFVGSLALLGITREPRPAGPLTGGRGRRRAGDYPDRPRGFRPTHRAPARAVPDSVPVLVASVAAVGAGTALAAYAAGPAAQLAAAFSDVLAVLIGFTL